MNKIKASKPTKYIYTVNTNTNNNHGNALQ